MTGNLNIQQRLEEILDGIKDIEHNFYNTHIRPDTADYIRYLAKKVTDVQFVENSYDSQKTQHIFNKIFNGIEGGSWMRENTYNYAEPWSADMEIARIKDGCSTPYIVALAPHYGGDIRGNYGDYVVLTFPSFEEYLELSEEYFQERSYIFEMDGKEYECHYNGAGEYYILKSLDGECFNDAFIPEVWSREDFIKSARAAVKGD